MIAVRVASRIHFGLLSFGASADTLYGGAGIMVNDPWLEVQGRPSDAFQAEGPHAEQINRVADAWSTYFGTAPPPLLVSTAGLMRDHVGLGFGTQLGLAVAKLLSHGAGIEATLPQLVASAARGRRSAVGSHGFAQGGFLYERGQSAEGEFPPLAYQRPLPEAWRMVLATQRGVRGCHGEQENQGFSTLPPVPAEVTQRLKGLIEEGMIPALKAADCRAFGEAVTEYGYVAGGCYLPIQSERYAGPVCCRLVEQMRGLGIAGVGQSSWGPTIFGICTSAAEAESAAEALRRDWSAQEMEIMVTAPANQGAILHEPAGEANLKNIKTS
ncbi:MAG: hypothetical protein WDZ51_04065 [Pirellulaceae bacterium]